MEFEFYLVNAFTDALHGGNGAGVCLLNSQQGEVSDVLKQKLAAEIKLSETAFVTSYTKKSNFQTESRFGLRWFTPATEIILCGHATLATAAALFYHVGNKNEKITFDTLSGPLTVEKLEDDKLIRMTLPWRDTIPANGHDVQQLVKSVVGDLPVNEVRLSPVARMPIIRLDDSVTLEQFESFKPVGAELLRSTTEQLIGVIVTLKGSASKGFIDHKGNAYDFVSRVFAPWIGVDEDPVCGSAHAVLAPYWAATLNKQELYACQSLKRRGELWLETKEQENNVIISGKFFIYLKGTVLIQ